ncbi:sorting nexin-1-like [Scleropages formosus]|uniref:sorting nexin-1-like n=1 Tax=Scleropages formosus TaxID=113540 RepID=UPI0010FAC8B3|nr:sorting nexin-1-like [Scleropages formosus]XP_018608095.2 sorting nexin-1-like [Scleropages formosus]
MATSSERSPPPFSQFGSQEPTAELRDGDSDEGEDFFTGRSNPKMAKSGAHVQPADLFGEPEVNVSEKPMSSGAKSNAFCKNTVSNATSRLNGVCSDDDQDLFSEANVEFSVDSQQNSWRNEVSTPSVSTPSFSNVPKASKRQPQTLEELEEEESGDKFELHIGVTNPKKVGDGMNAYMVYKVSTQTTIPMFRSKAFTVSRRFSDFLGLYEKLSEKHSQNGYIVPSPPEKSIVGMTKVKVGKEDSSSVEFVERRRAALERYLQRLVCHPHLLQDPDLREFLEKDELPRAVNTQTLSGAGLMKIINRATDAVNKMTIRMDESDIWFEEKLQELENEDQQLRKLHAVIDSLVVHRKELSGNTGVLAKSVAMLASSEDNTALSRALCQLAEVEEKMEQLQQEQAGYDFFIFAELLADYIRLLGAVRGCFDQRVKAWQRWQDAQVVLQKKRENEARMLWANKPERSQQAKDEIVEWEAKVSRYERDFERISATIRKEVLRFEKEKARDFQIQIMKYLEALLHLQQKVLKYWEAFLPEAKSIA